VTPIRLKLFSFLRFHYAVSEFSQFECGQLSSIASALVVIVVEERYEIDFGLLFTFMQKSVLTIAKKKLHKNL